MRLRTSGKFGAENSRSGARRMLRRPGFAWHWSNSLSRQAGEAAQVAFVKCCESLINGLKPFERVVLADAAHPERQIRPVPVWFPAKDLTAARAMSEHQRMNIRGSPELESMQIVREEGETVNAETARALFENVEQAWPRQWHLDNHSEPQQIFLSSRLFDLAADSVRENTFQRGLTYRIKSYPFFDSVQRREMDPGIAGFKTATFSGRCWSRHRVADFRETVALLPGSSRSELCNTFCERLSRTTAKGDAGTGRGRA